MKEMVDFKQIPEWWPLCGNSQCSRAQECMRHVAYTQAPQGVTRWLCLLPTAVKDGECRFFQKNEMVMMARGFSNMLKSVASLDARHGIRMELTKYFGSKGSYYRYRNGERWMNPAQQQAVADVLHRHGVEAASLFDEYQEAYDYHEE